MRLLHTTLVAVAYLCLSLAQRAEGQAQPLQQGGPTGALPLTNAETLTEHPLVLPRDLPAERTLVLMAFERDQRAALAGWKAGLELAASRTPWMELVVVGTQNAFVHAMIVRGVRRDIPEGPLRERTVPVFVEQEPLAASLGLTTQAPYALVMDRSGRVLAQAQGEYSPAKAQALLALLRS